MKSVLATTLLAVFSAAAAAASAVPDRPLVPDNKVNLFAENGGSEASSSRSSRIPTSYESAVLARRILALVSTGTISTVFPHQGVAAAGADSLASLPSGVAGLPIGLPEYIANCEEDDESQRGNPTVLAIRIATSFRNARAGSNVSLALEWVPPAPAPPAQRLSLWGGLQKMLGQPLPQLHAYHANAPSPAALPRFSLIGYLEPIPGLHGPLSPLATCFVRAHPDAKWWLPGNTGVHASDWMRLVVTHVCWIGGFGDRAYIGWIPRDEWHNVTRAEWEQAVLPGETSVWRGGADL